VLVETPDFQGFLLLSCFDNTLLLSLYPALVGVMVSGFDRNGESQQDRD